MGSGGWRQARIRLLGSHQVDDQGADGMTVARLDGAALGPSYIA
jgi:hypothetical protein